MPYQLSPSTINLMEDCPRCFWLEIKKNIARPRGIFPSLPSGMDRILKAHFDECARLGKLPPEIKELESEGIKVYSGKNLDNWRDNRKGITWRDREGNVLKGVIDALLTKGEKFIVLDYKTRGYPLKEDTHEHYTDQLDIYNYLLRKNKFETEDYFFLLFYHPDRVIDSVVRFHTDLIKVPVNTGKAEELWKKALAVLEGPMPESADECEYCSYRNKKIGTTLLDY